MIGNGRALVALVLAPLVTGCALAQVSATDGVQPQPHPGSCHARGSGGLLTLPDPHCTPGAVDPGVRQANVHRTICRWHYTEAVRPPESVTEPEKKASMAAYGDTGPLRDYEYDHILSGRRREGAIVLPACSLVGMSAREVG